MTIVFRLFLALVLAAPVFLIFDGLIARGILTAWSAASLFVIALTMRPGEAGFFSNTIRPYVLAICLVSLLFLLTLVPVPEAWRHPIWISAANALDGSVWGSATISPGDTLISFLQFLTAAGVFVIAAAVTIDRRRAEILLFILLTVSTTLFVVLDIHDGGGFTFLGEMSSSGARAAIYLSSVLALVLSLTMFDYAIERYETRHSRTDFGRARHVMILSVAGICTLIAIITILLYMPRATLVAASMSSATFLLIVGFRRAGVRLGFLIPLATLGIPALIGAQLTYGNATDFALRFASSAPSAAISTAQRIINDNGWLGSGPGTFADVAPLYAEPSQGEFTFAAPTSVSASIISFGRPLTCIFFALAFLAAVKLIHGALTRGRDSFFTAAAASCLVGAMIDAFIDTGLMESSSVILLAAVLGLGVAQSASRTAH